MKSIKIAIEGFELTAHLNDSDTAEKIYNATPFESMVNTWGSEIYFSIPVESPSAPNARADLEIGEIAFWPPGTAFCIFFGPTPLSQNERPRAASPVNVIGKIEGDPSVLRKVKGGATIQIIKA